VYVPYQEVFGRKLYDAGLRSHIGSHKIAKKLHKEYDELITIYSRTNSLKDYVFNIKDAFVVKLLLGFKIRRLMKVFSRTIEIMNLEISKNDEFQTDQLSAAKGKKVYKIFAEKKLQDKTFEASKEGNLEMFKMGEELGHKYQ